MREGHKMLSHAGSGEYTGTPQDNTGNTISRRTVLRAAIGLGAVAALGGAGAAAKFVSQSHGEHSSGMPDTNVDQSVTAPQALANIDKLIQDPNLFAGARDPHALIHLDREQIVDMGRLRVTTANQNDIRALAQDYIDFHGLLLNAGGTKEDLEDEIHQGLQIGVYDENGTQVTNMPNHPENHAQYINSHYGEPLLEGIGPDSITDGDGNVARMTSIKERIKGQQYNAANYFEFIATQKVGSSAGNPTLDVRTYLELQNVEELDVNEGLFSNDRFPGLENAKRAKVDFTTHTGRTNTGESMINSVVATYVPDMDMKTYQVLYESFGLEGQ
jgi:hypothetical protein